MACFRFLLYISVFYSFCGNVNAELSGGVIETTSIQTDQTSESGTCTPRQIQENQAIIDHCNANWESWGIDPPDDPSEMRQANNCAGFLSSETALSCGDAVMALPVLLGQLTALGMAATIPIDKNTFSYVSQNGTLQEIEAYLNGEFFKEICGLAPWEVNTHVSQYASQARQIKAIQDQRRALEERRSSEISRIRSSCRTEMRVLDGTTTMLLASPLYIASLAQARIAPTSAQVQTFANCVERETTESPELREELAGAANGFISQISGSLSSLKCYNARLRKKLTCEITIAVLSGGTALTASAIRRLGREGTEQLNRRIGREGAEEVVTTGTEEFAVESTESAVEAALSSTGDNEGVVNVIYYPLKNHTDIEVDGVVLNPFASSNLNSRNVIPGLSSASTRSITSRHLDLAARRGDLSFYRTSISMTDTELNELRSLLQTPSNNAVTCNGSVCNFLRRSTGESTVPFPINQAPSLSNLYMSLASRLGSSRITSMRYYGRNELNSRLAQAGMTAVEIPTLLTYGVGVPYVGWISYTSITSSGVEEEHFIPVTN